MRVSELARAGGVTAETVRHYTREGLLPSRRDPRNDYQLYDEEALGRLRLIDCLRCLGLSLKEIKEVLVRAERDNTLPVDRVDRLAESLPLIHSRVRELQTLASWLERARRRSHAEFRDTTKAPSLNQLMAELTRQQDGTTQRGHQ
ncbi:MULTISPECIES: MerR family transcriptional regulator [Halomonadaceae]|uniref:Transcriptional regulator, MerR family n=1 Tax=Modicisalibacter ilicicola DSM 19980 TaxID=1121942 RepID=A0A1M5CY88_9GAMM|nr:MULTISPECIES: MerR family transcriptional regulator [Halomonas]SHF59607.1 transcriptional regulator, MerR family [Halomonas ilicicola DSM 19980]